MDTGYSPEQEAFRDSLRRFIDDATGTAYTRDHWNDAQPFTATHWRQLAELGVTGLLAPEAAGGVGGDMSDMGVVMEEMGRAVQPGPCWASCVGATSAARVFALEDLLAQLAAGEVTATLALAEPGRRFTAWRDAAVTADDDRLSGAKTEVPDAVGADHLFVSTDRGVYLVAADAPGVTVTPCTTFDGSRRFGDLRLYNTPGVRLGDNAELAPVVDRMLIALCADAIGAAQRALELTVAHAGERHQFGQPIGAFQAVQHLCADMLQQLELGRAGLHYALWAADGADRQEAHRAAVMCKAYMAETLPQLSASAIQIFGGAGFTWEYDIQLYHKRLLSLESIWGTPEIWLEELATLVIDGEAPAIVP